jgi:uncharacterized protein (DUF2267 family)
VPRSGQVRLAKLTPPNVEKFRDDLLANMSRATARKVLTSFKSLLKAANHAHMVAQSPLGHSSIVMILDLYGHLFPRGDDRDELAASARALLARVQHECNIRANSSTKTMLRAVLQIRARRFDSGRGLHSPSPRALCSTLCKAKELCYRRVSARHRLVPR